VDGVLGNDRSKVFKHVLDRSGAAASAALERAAAVGADIEAMVFSPIDALGPGPPRRAMAFAGAGLAFAFGRRRPGVDGPLARGRSRIDFSGGVESAFQLGDACVLLGDAPGRRQQNQLDQRWIEGSQLLGLPVGEPAFQCRRRQRL